MGEGDLIKGIIFQAPGFVEKHHEHDHHQWMNMEDDVITSSSESSSLGEYSRTSEGSTSTSSDLVDDASSTNSNGPLYELSELMAQLPIKYYKLLKL